MLWSNKVSKLKLTHSFREMARAFFLACVRPEAHPEAIPRFEREFARGFGEREALAFPHARVALHFILKAFACEEGSEILMAPLTIADMVNSIHLAGWRPRFVDCDPLTLGPDIEALRSAITGRTRAILITYLGGIMPDVERITALAREHGLKVIEDCSQAVGASFRGRATGTWGDVAFFSLTNFKIVSSLFGGMVITADRKLTEALRGYRERELLAPERGILAKHAAKNLLYLVLFQRWVFSCFSYFLVLALEFLAPELTYRLYSGNIKVILGRTSEALLPRFPARYLCRYTGLQAELGLASLRRAPAVVSARTRNGERLRLALRSGQYLQVPERLPGAQNAYWRFPIFTPYVDELKTSLLLRGIDSAKMFLCLCSREPGFELYRAETPRAEALKATALVLEIDERLTEKEVDRMADMINRFFDKIYAGRAFEAVLS